MTFLSKLGKVLATAVNIIGVAAGIGPILAPFLGSKAKAVQTGISMAVNDLTSIGQVVLQAETLIQGTGLGATKLAAAAPLVGQIIQTSELIAGHKIANEALFVQGYTKVASGIADCLNAVYPEGVPEPASKPPAAVPAS